VNNGVSAGKFFHFSFQIIYSSLNVVYVCRNSFLHTCLGMISSIDVLVLKSQTVSFQTGSYTMEKKMEGIATPTLTPFVRKIQIFTLAVMTPYSV